MSHEILHISGNQLGFVDVPFWISGTNLPDNKTWISISIGKKLTYTNWAPGEPNNHEGEYCIEINQNNGLWNDYNCYSDVYFLCEKEK